MERVKTGFNNGAVYEVRRFNYDLGGYLMAEIEVFIYGEKSYRGQAKMFNTGQVVSGRETYPSLKQALESIVLSVEEVLRKDFDLEEKVS